MTDAPDPGLTDLIAAHKIQLFGVDGPHYQAETEYDGCLCGWQGAEEDHPAHVALVVEQHANGRIAALEAELEKQKRGGRTIGKAIDRTLKWVIEASNSKDLINDDGDGDWEIVWDRLFQLRPNLEAAIDRAEKAEATIARVRGEVSAYSEIIPAVALADLRAALEGEQQ